MEFPWLFDKCFELPDVFGKRRNIKDMPAKAICVPEQIRALFFSWGASMRLCRGTGEGKSLNLVMRDKKNITGNPTKKVKCTQAPSYNAKSMCIFKKHCHFWGCTKQPRGSSPSWSWDASFILDFTVFCSKQWFRVIGKNMISPELFLWQVVVFGFPVFG